jgi:hypothetical protein
MARGRKVCPWGCSGGQGEVDVVGAERVQVPGVDSAAALVRCRECQRISIARTTTAFSKRDDVPRKAESRTPLGRFEGDTWVPVSLHVDPLILTPTTKRSGQMRRGG